MAKIQKNVIVQGLSGRIGDLVFRQMPDGSTRVSAKPNFHRRKFSQKQKDHQSRFKRAAAYAREAARIQPIYAELARGTTKNAYNWALADWFNPPAVEHIKRREGLVCVTASDNVMVTKVQIRIVDTAGNVLEEGRAEQVDPARNPGRWDYATRVEGTVEATAWDLAGNRTKAVL